MPATHHVFSTLGQSLQRVLTHRLEESISWSVSSIDHLEQRLLDELRHEIEHTLDRDRRIAAHLLDRLEREGAVEHREPLEQESRLRIEKVVTPIHRRAQGPLPWQRDVTVIA